MQSYRATLGSDQTNKYGYRLGVEALASSMDHGWKGTPIFISHDFHRPAGISRANCLHHHCAQVLLKGTISAPETPEEDEYVEAFARSYLAQKLSEVEEADRNELTSLLDRHMSADAAIVRRECVSVLDPGIAKRVLPELFPSDEIDKRSLVQVERLQAIAPGVYKVGEYAVFAHRYFRRSLSQLNNMNDIFLEKIYALKGKAGCDAKVALDADSIGLASTYLTPIELEYWRGPRFDDNISVIPVGVTCHKASERERIFYGIDRTEFWWHAQSGKRSLECEEVLDRPSLGISEQVYGCRYAHSMIDEATGLPDHLDGAIREYGAEPFLERIEVDISKAGKNTRYVKLWRIDGVIELALWKELICDFFRGNPLPGEYLHEIKGGDTSGQNSFSPRSATSSDLAPVSVSLEDGLHVAVSCHDVSVFPTDHEGSIIPKWSLYGTDERPYVELSALDLIKMVNRVASRKVELPKMACFVAFEDMDINYPLFYFRGDKAVDDANAFALCLSKLCRSFVAFGAHRFITASVGINYGDRVFLVSFAGFAEHISKAFDHGFSVFPSSPAGIGAWCEALDEILKTSAPCSRFTAAAENLLTEASVFSLPRPFLDKDQLMADENGQFSVRIPESEFEVAQALHSESLRAAPAYLVVDCLCNGCNVSYLDCPCAALMKETDCVTVTNGQLLGLFLTERTAAEIQAS